MAEPGDTIFTISDGEMVKYCAGGWAIGFTFGAVTNFNGLWMSLAGLLAGFIFYVATKKRDETNEPRWASMGGKRK